MAPGALKPNSTRAVAQKLSKADKTRQDMIGQIQTEQNSTEQNRTEQDGMSVTQHTTQQSTGTDDWPNIQTRHANALLILLIALRIAATHYSATSAKQLRTCSQTT